MLTTASFSTASLTEASRRALLRTQRQLADAQTEMTTGRAADVGLALGGQTVQSISLRHESARMTALVDANSALNPRLDMLQNTLGSLTKAASGFNTSALAGYSGPEGLKSAVAAAKDGIGSSVALMNASYDGTFLFSGIASDVKPVNDYNSTPTSAARQSVIDAFTTRFGFAPGDPAAGSLTAADVTSFLDNEFATLFADPAWQTNWSNAADSNARQRISMRELVEVPGNANDAAMRKLLSAQVMVADLGLTAMSADAAHAVLNRASSTAGSAMGGFSSMSADVGLVQERVAKANERMSLASGIIDKNLGELEGVDTTEAAMRLSALTTQLETTYAMTGRLQRLSLVNYL